MYEQIRSLSRRHLLATAALGLTLLSPGFNSALADQKEQAAHHSPTKTSLTADEAMKRLKKGNDAFVKHHLTHPDVSKTRMLETAKGGQHPFATILACSDSRVPVEDIFDQGVGDLFVIRIAGNVMHTDEAASIEYGAGHVGTPLIVVMGHTQCGAVTAVVKGDKVSENISKLVEHIGDAVERSKAKTPALTGDDLVNDAVHENVKESINELLKSSEEVSKLVSEGKVKIVGAVYHIDDGHVEWMM